jgi:hypothetical protein
MFSLLTMVLVAGNVFLYAMLDTRKTHKDLIGSISSPADVDAMLWLRDHAPEDANILNHPGPLEGDWAPVVTERDTIYLRPQYFFQNTNWMDAEQNAFRAFWSDPTNPEYENLFCETGVTYVLVPQIIGDPGGLEPMTRWLNPEPEAAVYSAAAFEDIPYLHLVYERDGAQVFEVRPAQGSCDQLALSPKVEPERTLD